MKKIILIISAIFMLSASSSNGQISFAINGALDYGFGGKFKIGSSENIGVEIGGGILPIFVFWEIMNFNGDNDSYFKFYLSPSFGGAVSFAISKVGQEKQLDLKVLGIYNDLMETGIGLGIDYLVKKGDNKIWLTAGFLYYSNAYDNLLDDLIKSEELYDITKDDVSAVLVNFKPYFGISFEF